VQAVYARLTGSADNSATLYSSIASWAGNVDTAFNASAAKTGATRHVRFVTDARCNLVVSTAQISSAAITNFGTFVTEMKAAGFNRADRKYLVWTDANTFCGIAQVYADDSANTTPNLVTSNASNGNTQVDGTLGRIDNACWGLANPVEAHELVHTLGGVQTTAPHATQGFHCTDGADRMCYLDGTAPGFLTQTCPSSEAGHLDCNNDDYFSTSPPAGNYLATHWNVANSAFLDTGSGQVVVAVAGDAATEKMMAGLASVMDNGTVTIGGDLQRLRVINIPTFSASS